MIIVGSLGTIVVILLLNAIVEALMEPKPPTFHVEPETENFADTEPWHYPKTKQRYGK